MRVMWFGTRGFERWIKMPRVDQARGQFGWNGRSDHVAGGTTIKNSIAGHMEYQLEWNAITTEQTQQIRDILDGLYNTDENRGLLYFHDPSAIDVNAFSKVWGTPSLAAPVGGAPSLTKGVRPVAVATGANAFRLPPLSATFTVVEDAPRLTFYAPIPPGFTAHFAFYGPTAQTDKIIALPYTAGVAGTPADVDVLDNDDYGTGYTTSSADGIEFYLNDAAGTVTLTTALLKIVPTGETPPAVTEYLSGRGHSGCKVDDDIDQVLANARIDRETLGARLVEQGSWL